jgi:hypothetical protein
MNHKNKYTENLENLSLKAETREFWDRIYSDVNQSNDIVRISSKEGLDMIKLFRAYPEPEILFDHFVFFENERKNIITNWNYFKTLTITELAELAMNMIGGMYD